ncbi:hypothetical protein LCGC14_0717690 [marine sediment metagenome]|uniref:Uncharacterized protein n=1 Tax=marine sediment metagenome TaxID=412755 RepID=A0A0F9QHP6_9ZZZZ
MGNVATDIGAMLIDEGVGTLGTDLFIGSKPANVDACVVVFPSGGSDPEPDYNYERPRVQVYVRGPKEDFLAPANKAEAVKTALKSKTDITKNGVRYVTIWQEGDVIHLGMDENGRHQFTVNFRIHRTT